MRLRDTALFLSIFTLYGCGGGSSSSSISSNPSPNVPPPPAADTTSPAVTFNPSSLSVRSGESANSTLTATDNVGVTEGPSVTCTNGGMFSGDTFTAPTTNENVTSVCTATATDAAGNSGTGTLTVSVTIPEEAIELFTVSRAEVFESAIFSIILNDSQDTNVFIDDRTIDIQQISGSEASVFSVGFEVFEFRAPSLDFDGTETLSFEVTSTDFNGTDFSEILDVTVIGRSGPGIPVAVYDPPLTLEVGNAVALNGNVNSSQGVTATRNDTESFNSDLSEIIFIGGDTLNFNESDFQIDNQPVVNSDLIEGIDSIDFGTLDFNLLNFGPAFFALSQAEDRLRYFDEDGTGDRGLENFSQSDAIEIENPCFVTGRQNTGQDFMFVGQNGQGLSIVQITDTRSSNDEIQTFEDVVIETIGDGRSLCFLFPTMVPNSLNNFVDTPRLSDLLAVDYSSNELVIYADLDVNDEYEELAVIPLETETNEILEVVDVISNGNPSQLPRALAIVLTNGEHEGIHRLINITQDRQDEINQETYSWESGVPIALVQGNFGAMNPDGGIRQDDLVVITSTSPQSLFFENVADTTNDTSAVPVYAQPTFFDVGIGAGSAVSVDHRNFSTPEFSSIQDILVSFPETGELRIFTADPDLPLFNPPPD